MPSDSGTDPGTSSREWGVVDRPLWELGVLGNGGRGGSGATNRGRARTVGLKVLLVGPGYGSIGGVAAYMAGIARGLADSGHDVVYAGRLLGQAGFDRLLVTRWRRHRVGGAVVAHLMNPLSASVHTDRPVRDTSNLDQRFWLRLIRDVRPQLIHIHSFYGWPAAGTLADLSLPFLFTCHEYFGVCQRGTLVTADERPCTSFIEQSDCLNCIVAKSSTKVLLQCRLRAWGGEASVSAARRVAALFRGSDGMGTVDAFRSTVQGDESAIATEPWRRRLTLNVLAMNSSSLVLAVSESVREHLLAVGVRSDLVVVDHIGSDSAERVFATPLPPESKTIRLLFHAGYVNNKGGHVLLGAMSRLGGDFDLRMMGGGSTEYIERLRGMAEGSVRIEGVFDRDALNGALAQCHAVVIPTIGPDTSPQTVYEALAAGRPVVASRIGGIPDFVLDHHNGLLAEPGSVESLTRQLSRLRDRSLLEHLASNARLPRTVADHIQGLVDTYYSLIQICGSGCGRQQDG